MNNQKKKSFDLVLWVGNFLVTQCGIRKFISKKDTLQMPDKRLWGEVEGMELTEQKLLAATILNPFYILVSGSFECAIYFDCISWVYITRKTISTNFGIALLWSSF